MDELHPVNFSRRNPASITQTRIKDNDEFEQYYTIGRELGKGAFGVVRLVTHKKTRVKYAVKMQDKSQAGSSGVAMLEREVAIMKLIDHPHCVNLHEVFESKDKMFLVMEYASGGEVLQQLMEKIYYPEDEGRIVVKRLASAVAYLHAQDVVHRDIKLENLLVATEKGTDGEEDDEMYIKLSDFGLSMIIGRDEGFMAQTCGTPMYMAPEVFDEKGYSKQCDVWSIGVIMYFVLCGSPPFYANSEAELYNQIREAKPTFAEDAWKDLPQTAKALVVGMLKPDPASRISAKEILDHPWIRGEDVDDGPSTILEMMKKYNLERRFRKAQNVVIATQRFMFGMKTEETSTAAEWATSLPNDNPCASWDLSHKMTDKNACGKYGPPMEYDRGSHYSLVSQLIDEGQPKKSESDAAASKAEGDGVNGKQRLLKKRTQKAK